MENMKTGEGKRRYQFQILRARSKIREAKYIEAYDILGGILLDMEK